LALARRLSKRVLDADTFVGLSVVFGVVVIFFVPFKGRMLVIL